MESTARGRSAAAVDGVGDGRRFPDPPPPHDRDTGSALPDMAALVYRRVQLLQELHRERIRHDMIMCELAKTERVMTACLAEHGVRCGMPLMTPWEEAMYGTSRSREDTSWSRRSPSVPAIPPVYPCVERSPSQVLQPRPVDDDQKEERGRPLAVGPSAPPDVEQCLSLSKQPAVEEALIAAATNVVAKPAQLLLSSKEVTLESKGADDHEHKAGFNIRHALQLRKSRFNISEQLNRAAVDQEHKAEAKDTHAGQLMDCEVQKSEQQMQAVIDQECRAEVKDSHDRNQMEFIIKKSEQLKSAAIVQERQVDTNVRHGVQVMESKLQRSGQVQLEAVDKEKAEVKNHEAQLMESEIHKSEQPKREASGQEHEAEEDRHAGQLSKISEGPKPGEPTIKGQTDDQRRQLPHQYALTSKEKSPPNEQRLVFSERYTKITPSGVKRRQMLRRPTVESPSPKRHNPGEEWSCTQCQMSLSCEEDLARHQAGDLHRLNVAALQPRQEPAALITPKSTPESSYCAPGFSGLVRAPPLIPRLVRPALSRNLEKREPENAKLASGFSDLHNHPKGRSHQGNPHAMPTEECGKEGSRTGTEDPRKKFVPKPFCQLCKVQCNSEKMMESHLGGKKHRENLQAHH